MAKRFNQLTQLTAAQLAQNDIIPIRDESAGQTKYITVKDLTGSPDTGWVATGEAWTFSSYSATTNIGVFTVPTDATTKYAVGMFVRFSQTTGGTKYGRILAVTATTLSVWFGGVYTLNNETVTSPVYSPLAHPVGAPITITEGQPYKASLYRNAAYNTAGAALTRYPMDTKIYDTAGNADVVTNQGRFTAPVSGYYDAVERIGIATASPRLIASLYKNGAEVARGSDHTNASPGSIAVGQIYLAAGDYLEPYYYCSGVNGVEIGTGLQFFQIKLASR